MNMRKIYMYLEPDFFNIMYDGRWDDHEILISEHDIFICLGILQKSIIHIINTNSLLKFDWYL